MRQYIALVCLLSCLTVILSSCSEATRTPALEDSKPVKTMEINETSEIAEVQAWTFTKGWDQAVKGFEEKYPNIKIKFKDFTYEELNNAYMKALSAGNGPDIMVFDSSFFGQYTVNGILEDLLKEPYSAGKYEKDFPKGVWESNKSVDNKNLLAMTFVTSPVVTYYRQDIMKKNGFPSEPDEFGKFIEKPDNLLAIAKKLKAKGQYIFQWPTDLPLLLGSSSGTFDSQLKYVRNTDSFAEILDIARSIHKSGLEFEGSFWDESGKKAVQDSKLVMLFNLGSWGCDIIQSYVPEQEGKWRVTKPPLGINAWSSDTKLAINFQSKYKEQAWKFIEYMATHQPGGENGNMVNGYIPARRNQKMMTGKNVFLGWQAAQPLYEDLADRMVQYKLTPLDDKATQVFIQDISDGAVRNVDSKKAIKDMTDKIENVIAEERKALLE